MNGRACVLAALSAVSLCWAGAMHFVFYQRWRGVRAPLWDIQTWIGGLWYAVPLAAVLVAHEGAHWLRCRHYGLRTSGPYFLPLGLPLVGTMGAFLRVHQPFPTRRAMLDVALAGPLAGSAVAILATFAGASWTLAHPDATVVGPYFARFGRPWLIEAIYAPNVSFHPVALAGWVGLIITGLNLLPYGSFDGGAIVAALAGRDWALAVSMLTLIGAVALSFHSMTAFVLMLVMGVVGWSSPDVLDQTPLPLSAWGYGALALVLALVCLA